MGFELKDWAVFVFVFVAIQLVLSSRGLWVSKAWSARPTPPLDRFSIRDARLLKVSTTP